MISYNSPQSLSALDAKFEAQKIAFAPLTFQATVAMLDLKILDAVDDSGIEGITLPDISKKIDISSYGVGVLLDMGLSMGIFWVEEGRYILDKIGHFLLNDPLTRANLNFSKDVCYRGSEYITASIQTGKPEGLKTFGDWKTIYPWLSQLPKTVKKSWFDFDHFYPTYDR